MASLQSPAPLIEGTAVFRGEFTTVNLNDSIGRYVVLFFYPMDFTVVSSSDIVALSKSIVDFQRLKCDVIGISCDSQYTHLAWSNKLQADGYDLNFPLLSDKSTTISRKYGVFNEYEGTANRAVFIIDRQQVLRHILKSDDLIVHSVEEILRLIAASKVTDEQDNQGTNEMKRGIKRPVRDEDGSFDMLVKSCRTSVNQEASLCKF